MPIESMPIESMPIESMPIESMPIESMPIESMPIQRPGPEQIPTEHLTRAAGAVALAAVAVIHVLDLPSTITATPLIGYGYLLLIGVAVAAAAMLMTVPGPRVWAVADLVAAGAIGAYVLSRTTGLPTDRLDIGNWNCALGIAAVSTETLIVLLAAWRMQPRRLLLGPDSDRTVSADPTATATADFLR